jgi:CubicO group peptidase (beta-lactamase class C family)
MKILSLFATFVFLFLESAVYAQVDTAATPLSDTVDFAEERALIGGTTMGQKMESLLFWSVVEKERRFPYMHRLFPSLEVAAGGSVSPMEPGTPLLHGEQTYISNYMDANNVKGLLVLKDGKVRVEAYAEGVGPLTTWTSFSVGKSVTSMLLGIALKEGAVKSLDDTLSKYIPELQGQAYGEVTVRQLLTMTSGIQWNEDYADHDSDVAQMYLQPCEGAEPHILTYMKALPAVHPAGEVFNYSTGETDLLGLLVQRATGKTLAAYLSKKIWQPWGMESKAYWLADECSGLNLGGSGLSATLRDYGRLGMVMLDQGAKNGEQLFAQEWINNATSLEVPVGDDCSGYGYLWWRFPDGSYGAFGIFGQMIYINPKTKVVIAQYAAWPQAGSKVLSAARAAFIEQMERMVN